MATIHLMQGFIGFGKTTVAQKLEKDLPAVRLTHDDIMLKRYGRAPDDFDVKYKIVDDYIKAKTKELIENGTDVILDYGLWSKAKRKEYYEFAKSLTPDVIFHVLDTDLNVAKQRCINRSKTDEDSLFIDANAFDGLLKHYEPWEDSENYPVVLHNTSVYKYIGKTVWVKMDRPLGSKHPKHGFEYPVNYGFLPYTVSGDGEELDAYVLGVQEPLDRFIGKCVAVVHRTDDDDDKLIVVPHGQEISDKQIEEDVAFQEKWFKHKLVRNPKENDK